MSKQDSARIREPRKVRAVVAQRSGKHRRLLAGGVVVILGLVVAIVAVVVVALGGRGSGGAEGGLVAPAGATVGGALAVGPAGAPVRLEVYVDYMCPFCGQFERANGAELNRLVADGTVRLELYPMSFLDRLSGGSRYSTRAANAVATVADRAPDRVLAFTAALFDAQPAEGTVGRSDDEIAVLARHAGVGEQVIGAFADRAFEPWIARSTATVFDSGITGTPTVKINGTVFPGDLYAPGPLTRAITAAAGG